MTKQIYVVKRDDRRELLDYEKINNDVDISIIGHITEDVKERVLISKSGAVHPLKAQGWKAF